MRARERTRKRAVVLTCARACLLGRFTQAAGQGILEKKCPTFNRLCLAAMRTEAARKRACTKESECARVLLCFQTAACASWCTPGPSCGHRLARLSTAARSYSRRWALRFCVQRREFHPPCSRTRPPTRLVSEAAGRQAACCDRRRSGTAMTMLSNCLAAECRDPRAVCPFARNE